MDVREINERVKEESAFVESVFNEVRKVIVGQDYMLERMLIGILSGGHMLLEGVPGLAKTLSISTFAKIVDTGFKRIQFTPDLLPADVIGTMVFNQKDGTFTPKKGPIFSNIVLADEINRAPAKVQSALLEAMQERQVTIGDTTWPLSEPFLVLATQNPIEQEGTYPLPEAQVDRFMLKLKIDYPSKREERMILDRMTGPEPPPVDVVVSPEDIVRTRNTVRSIYIDDRIKDYIVDLVYASRAPADYGLSAERLIQYGASPRATIYLTLASRAHAFVRGRGYVTPEDVKAVGPDVLRHRIILTYEAEADEITPDHIVDQILDAVEVP